MGSLLDAQSSEFDERNSFLFLSLGLLSLGDRLEALLRRHAPEHPERGTHRTAHDVEPLAYLALGAIRMSDVIRRELRAATERARPADAIATVTGDCDAIADVLR